MKKVIKNHYFLVILICCCLLTGLIHGLEGGISGLFYGPMSQEFQTPVSAVALYMTIKGIAMVAFTPISSSLILKYNLKLVLGFAILFYSLSLLAIAFSNSIQCIWGCAVLMGFSASFLSTTIVPYLIGNWFQKGYGLALGIAFGFSGFTGSMLGPIFSKIINEHGWRHGYLGVVVLLLTTLFPAIILLVRRKPNAEYVASREDTVGKTQNNIVNPVLDEKLMKQYFRSTAFKCAFCLGISLALVNGILFNLPNYMSSLGYSISLGSLAVSCALIGATSFKILFGWLNDWVRPYVVVLIAAIVGGCGLLFMLCGSSSAYLILLGSFLYGSIISLMTLEPPVIMKKVFGNEYYYRLFIYVNMVTQFCYAAGPTLYAMVYDATCSYDWSFVISIFFALISFPLSYFAAKKLDY